MKLNLAGVPSCAGALHTGTELTPTHLRTAGLVDVLAKRGVSVNDLGDLEFDGNSRHNVPPVRNWPAPRNLWEAIDGEGARWFTEDAKSLILGGDCSLVTGTVSHLYKRYGEKLHLLLIDAHVDAVRPDAARCVGAAGMGLWFLTNESAFWPRPEMAPSQMTVVACQNPPQETYGIRTVTLEQVRAAGAESLAASLLAELPEDAKVLIHWDVDSLSKEDMPAAYSPSEVGLSAPECRALLGRLLADERVIGLEVTEFSAVKDPEGAAAAGLVQILAGAFAL